VPGRGNRRLEGNCTGIPKHLTVPVKVCESSDSSPFPQGVKHEPARQAALAAQESPEERAPSEGIGLPPGRVPHFHGDPVKSQRGHGMLKGIVVTVLCLVVVGAHGCAKKPDEVQAPARRYEIRGKVVSVDREKKQVVVAHEEIPGFMDAMTMPFALKDTWPLTILSPGQSIRATLAVGGGRSWLEEIVVTEAPALPADAAEAGSATDPAPGTKVPGVVLVNQDGRKVRPSDFSGRYLLLTFIYTRCPLPDYCPRMGEYFLAILKEVESDPLLSGKVHLMSVSFDPEFDQPKVLREYGMGWLGRRGEEGFRSWSFASGDGKDVKRFSQFFGLSYWRETNQIVHSLRTALIDPNGRLAVLYRGNEWKPREIVDEIRRRIAGERADGSR